MQLITSIRTFDCSYEFIEFLTTDYVYQIEKHLKMKLLSMTTGKHKIAKRPHFHITMLWDILGNKCYFNWEDQLRRLNNSGKIGYPTKEVASKVDAGMPPSKTSAVTFCYENGVQTKQKKKQHQFSQSAMMYPLKEYKCFKDIPTEYCLGYSDDMLEQFRKAANLIYEPIGKRYINEELKQLREKELKDNLYSYLDEVLKSSPDLEALKSNPRDLIFEIKIQILNHHKVNETSFRMNLLDDQALNYAFKKNLLDNHSIITNFSRY